MPNPYTTAPSTAASSDQRALEKVALLEARVSALERQRGVVINVFSSDQINNITQFEYFGGRLYGVSVGGTANPSSAGVVTMSSFYTIGSLSNWLLRTGVVVVSNTTTVIAGSSGIYNGTALTPGLVTIFSTVGSSSAYSLSLLLIEYPT